MAHVLQYTVLSRAVHESEDRVSKKSTADLVLSVSTKHLSTMKAKVRVTIGACNEGREVLRKTIVETFRNIFLDGYGAVEKGMQDCFHQIMIYVQGHLVSADTPDSISWYLTSTIRRIRARSRMK